MSWLKKIGQWIVAGIKLEAGLAPFARVLYPQSGPILDKVESELTQLAGIVVTAEAFGATTGLPGAEKIRVAGPLVGQLVQQSSLMVGKKIKDSAKFALACQTISGGMADLLNSLEEPTPS